MNHGMTGRCVGVLALGMVLAWTGGAQAQGVNVPYHGRLASNGSNVNTVQSMRFEVFPADTGGVALQVIDQDVTVANGLFSVELPLTDATLDSPTLFLQLSVGPQGGALTPLAGRQRLHPAALAHRGSPEAVFKANGVATSSLTTSNLAVGPLSVGPTGMIASPSMRSKTLVSDQQGLVSGALSWSYGTACTNGRPGCVFMDVPFQSYGGTVMMTVESTGYRAAVGLGELWFILDPDPTGGGTNAGTMRMYFSQSNVHMALPTYTITIPTQYFQCNTPPCNHTMRIITRSNANVDVSGTLRVNGDDYIRVTFAELPYFSTP